jgi:NAD(P)-dependent dehydrogenase (short-subunit alcohol dehydrogenase family)
MLKLENKVAIVTGGARGIGEGIAQALCSNGAAVLITDILAAEGEQTAEKLRSQGYQVEFISHDIRDEQAWTEVVDRALERFGRVDCLVNNAGINAPHTIESATAEDFRNVLDINLIGAFTGMKAVLEPMKEQGGGSIINISSNSTRKMVALTTIYGASKASLAYISKTAAIHFAESGYGIRVNSVHPGPVETDMLLGPDRAADIPEVRQMIDSIPIGRMGLPGDIGSVVAFLASDDAGYMTAAELFVDGGVNVV